MVMMCMYVDLVVVNGRREMPAQTLTQAARITCDI